MLELLFGSLPDMTAQIKGMTGDSLIGWYRAVFEFILSDRLVPSIPPPRSVREDLLAVLAEADGDEDLKRYAALIALTQATGQLEDVGNRFQKTIDVTVGMAMYVRNSTTQPLQWTSRNLSAMGQDTKFILVPDNDSSYRGTRHCLS